MVLAIAWLLHIGKQARRAEWGNWLANRIDGINRRFMHGFHRMPPARIALPASGPAIVVANHISGLDAFMLLASCRRPLHFLIAEEQYNRPGMRWLFDLAGCIPVEKTTRPERALRAALRELEAGRVIALFPFGRMHLDSDPPIKIKGGVAVLAGRTGATIYPARIEGTAVRKKVTQAIFKRGHPKLFPLDPISLQEHETPREMLHRLSEALSTPIEEAT